MELLALGYGLLTSTPTITSLHTHPHTVNPLLDPPPPGRVYSFQTNLMGGGASLRRGGLFDLEKTMVSVLHKKKLGYNVERLKYKKLEVMQLRIKTDPNFQLVNKPSHPHKVPQS